MNGNQEEDFPSLQSDFDFEPNLEFDDELDAKTTDAADDDDRHRRQTHDSDDTHDDDNSCHMNQILLMDDDFETAFADQSDDDRRQTTADDSDDDEPTTIAEPTTTTLANSSGEDFSDLSALNVLEVNGDDFFGRIVISIHGSRLPARPAVDWNRFLRFLLATLDQFVEIDYTLVYFHFGLQQKPPARFLWTAFRSFDRKYRKHLKALLLVHPTPFTRLILSLFKPLISVKFGRKVHNISRLEELSKFLRSDQLSIPQTVQQHDRKLKSKSQTGSDQSKATRPLVDTLEGGERVPRVLRTCVDFLSEEQCLQTEGLFRRSASALLVGQCQRQLDSGLDVDFRSVAEPEVATHLAAALVKQFLRRLEEPLLTFELFDDVIDFHDLKSHVERVTVAQALIRHKLPELNRRVLEYVLRFLRKVQNRSDLNKMNAKNLSIVLGPNLLWSRDLTHDARASLDNVLRVNQFVEFLFTNDVLLVDE